MSGFEYEDGTRVEVGDIVARANTYSFLSDDDDDDAEDGEVVQIMPRLGAVKIRYEDHHDAYRSTGKPRIKTDVVDPSQLNLVRRTM